MPRIRHRRSPTSSPGDTVPTDRQRVREAISRIDAVMRVRAEAGDRDFAQAIEQWKARSSDSEPAPSAG